MKTRRRNILISLIWTVVLTIPAFNAGAFQLTPMKIELTSQGPRRSTSLTIENTTPEAIAVQVRVLTREVLPDGSERNEPMEGLFRVYPSQIIVRPGATQVLRLQYAGPPEIDVEQAYRLEARQLPIDVDNPDGETATGVRIVLRYLATLYVAPPDAEVRLHASVRNVDIAAHSGELVISNRGTAHADLIGRAVVLSSGEMTERFVLTDFGENYAASLPAGFARVIPLTGRIRFEPETVEIVAE